MPEKHTIVKIFWLAKGLGLFFGLTACLLIVNLLPNATYFAIGCLFWYVLVGSLIASVEIIAPYLATRFSWCLRAMVVGGFMGVIFTLLSIDRLEELLVALGGFSEYAMLLSIVDHMAASLVIAYAIRFIPKKS